MSQLKLCHKLPEKISHLPVIDIFGPYCPQPQQVLDRRLVQKGNKVVTQVLVQWVQTTLEQANWEDYHSLRTRFPSFLPEGRGRF